MKMIDQSRSISLAGFMALTSDQHEDLVHLPTVELFLVRAMKLDEIFIIRFHHRFLFCNIAHIYR